MSAIFESVLGTTFTLKTYLLCLACALVCGILAALAASYKSQTTKSFLVSLVLLPMIVETVIVMVNGNVGTGVAVMGAFSLVRFRSVPGKAKDIVSIFLVMTAGLACAAGYVAISILFTMLVCGAMMLLACMPLGDEKILDLRITVPETLHYADAFEDLFQKYTKKCRLVRVKTSNMGSLYKLQYQVQLKDTGNTQAFLDDLRCRNGNLEISLGEGEGSEVL